MSKLLCQTQRKNWREVQFSSLFEKFFGAEWGTIPRGIHSAHPSRPIHYPTWYTFLDGSNWNPLLSPQHFLYLFSLSKSEPSKTQWTARMRRASTTWYPPSTEFFSGLMVSTQGKTSLLIFTSLYPFFGEKHTLLVYVRVAGYVSMNLTHCAQTNKQTLDKAHGFSKSDILFNTPNFNLFELVELYGSPT